MASSDETKSLDPRSSTCGVCLEQIEDPRLLDCLHSFCRRCVDQLVLASSSTDERSGRRTVRCPLCRSVCPIPEEGAEGLVKDVTRPTEREEPKCHACEEEGECEKASLSCAQCRLAFCDRHALRHAKGSGGHSLSALPEAQANDSDEPQTSVLLCAVHKQPLDFRCASCGEAVCSHCISVGQHAGHTPIVLRNDVVTKRKDAVFTKVDELQDLLPQIETALTSVDKMSTDLASRADQVRDEIRAAGQRVIDAVSMGVAKKLQEVEGIEQVRSKNLDKQHDELKELAEGVKSVISFTDTLKTTKVSAERMDNLLPAVEKRVASLRECELSLEPKEHSVLFFEGGGIEDVAAAAALEQSIGKVSSCRAIAMETIFEGTSSDGRVRADVDDSIFTGESVTVTMQAKGTDREPLSAGGDIVKTQWISSPGSVPPVTVTDHGNGRYLISFTPQEVGEYNLAVSVNGIRTETISTRCRSQSAAVTFDPQKCDERIAISDRCHSATLTEAILGAPVLGTPGMKTGQHQWRVQVSANASLSNGRFVGIVPQSEADQALHNHTFGRSWNGKLGQVLSKGKRVRNVGRSWENNDIIQVDLDCDAHIVRMTNLRSGYGITFEKLPAEEYFFPYFNLSGKDATMTLL